MLCRNILKACVRCLRRKLWLSGSLSDSEDRCQAAEPRSPKTLDPEAAEPSSLVSREFLDPEDPCSAEAVP